jgi:linoleoyl-CoA desaturase
MKAPIVRFNTKAQPEFFRELRLRVNTYFNDKNLSPKGNTNMVLKTIFMVSLYFVPLALLLSGIIQGTLLMFVMWTLMGLGMSGIGLSIMHDANHGSYSQNRNVNKFFGYLVNFLGAYHVNWIMQHNILHHSFTNVDGFDEDIDNGFFRFAPQQPRKKIFKFQKYYAPLMYGMMTLFWFLGKDFIGLKRYEKKNMLAKQGYKYKNQLALMTINKVLYTILTIVLPLIIIDLPWWQIMLGFVLMHYISGLTLALIFQPAHVLEETSFYAVDEKGSVENNWAVHQMKTTANFANKSRWFTWLIGGLNFQIEHHLFPNICHVHYRKISKIVQDTAAEFNVPYYHHKTFAKAVGSHFRLLHDLGTGKYDLKLATANS